MQNDSDDEDKQQKEQDKVELAIEHYGMRVAPKQ